MSARRCDRGPAGRRRPGRRASVAGLACALVLGGCATAREPVPTAASAEIPAEGPAAEAAAQMQTWFLEVWEVTRDDTLTADARRERVEALVRSRLDAAALSRAALGSLAKRFSPEERRAFEDAYLRYVTRRFSARFARHPEHPVEIEGVSWNAERKVAELSARGAATVAGVPGVRRLAPRERIRLRLALREGSDGIWRVLGLAMNEVDVSRNFRDQFRSLLEREAPADLVAELEERNARDAGENPFE